MQVAVALAAALVLACACASPAGPAPDTVIDLSVELEPETDVRSDASPAACFPATVSIGAKGVSMADLCGKAWVKLLPSVLLDGKWRGRGSDGICELAGDAVACPAGGQGQVIARIGEAGAVVVEFQAGESAVVQGLALSGTGRLAGATSWLSNGFQSWSLSGMVAIGPSPGDGPLMEELQERGDSETQRDGTVLSWWYTLAGGEGPALFAGALTAARFKPWVQVHDGPAGQLKVRLGCGGTGESISVEAGESVLGEPWMVELTDHANAALESYGASLPARRKKVPVPAEAGWNSWYELWDDVDEAAVRENAELAAGILEQHFSELPDLPLRIVVDDGWQIGWGQWQPNEKFPSGLDGLAADLKQDGFEMGVWLAPLLVDHESALAAEHPDWFVEGIHYFHPKNGNMLVLDPTHPEGAAHLADVVSTLVGWGYSLLKIDFLFVAAYEAERHERMTGLAAYHRAMQVIREAAGEETLLLAVGAPPLPSFPYVDSWRLGADIASPMSPLGWPLIADQVRSLAVRWPLCLATLCDADPVLLRELPQEMVESGGWVAAFSGGALFLSDDLRNLPGERHGWGVDPYRAALALGGIPSCPEKLFPPSPPDTLASILMDMLLGQNTHVVPVVWQLPDGKRAAFNASDLPVEVESVAVPPMNTVLLD